MIETSASEYCEKIEPTVGGNRRSQGERRSPWMGTDAQVSGYLLPLHKASYRGVILWA
jgi:hypothetical protein